MLVQVTVQVVVLVVVQVVVLVHLMTICGLLVVYMWSSSSLYVLSMKSQSSP